MFRLNFESDGISIETFVDPEAALRRVARKPPDVAFIDLRFPTTTGEQVAARMDAAIPKVLVTGDLAVEGKGGFLRVFHKPYDFQEVERFIAGLSVGRIAG